uniref:Cytochrome c oxidase subunit 3 n=1 Tax=Gnathostomula armata TaxID=231613 RepID=A0A0F6Q169_9BILA|nr:cytochrome c oxidase subunit 3 [Gnathostomula armata]AKD00019.1 cytochrome c oxidase subunit 3 [Gnathostomula armata]
MLNKHMFHIVMISPWPLITAIMAFSTIWSFMVFLKFGSYAMLLFSVFLLSTILFTWWKDVSHESSYEGMHAYSVSKSIQYGMIWFIISEIMFFSAFFWSFFDSSLVPLSKSYMIWPSFLVTALNPVEVPLLNTLILLSSGVTVTLSHHSMIKGFYKESFYSLVLTVFLGMYFTFLQWMEYKETQFNISDSMYGSIFFMGTGFHGFHVIIGSIFLLLISYRVFIYSLSKNSHLGFELAAWYWHFVDVVWLFLYSFVYWWGK